MLLKRLKIVVLALSMLAVALVPVSPASAVTPLGGVPTNRDFVIQQYEDFLSRQPDAGGLNYWTALLDGGVPPSALVEALALSPEFQGNIAPVVRLYYAHFLRPPGYDGITYWSSVVRNGATISQVSDEFVLSQEFQNRYGALTDDQYINLVYQNVLGRPADANGLAYWNSQMDAGMSRGGVMVQFSDSTEYRNTIDPRVQATMLYVGMLRRAPEPNGLDYWTSVLAGGGSYAAVIAGFLAGTEYDGRMAAIYSQQHPLSGVATKQVANYSALAVKIDNVDRARPPVNIDRADIIYEEMVEFNLTRLIAVFHSDMPPIVGPVRSIRTSDIDILAQLQTPLLSASGANSGVLAAIAQADAAGTLVNLNATVAGSAYFRDNSLRAPHNMFVNTSNLYPLANGRGGNPIPLFEYRADGDPVPGGVPVQGVTVNYGNALIDFDWDPALQGWARKQNRTAHVTKAGKQLAPKNVVVLNTQYGVSPADANSPEVISVGGGNAYVFTDGQIVFGTWTRPTASDVITILDEAGNPIPLTPGQTFVEFAPIGTTAIR